MQTNEREYWTVRTRLSIRRDLKMMAAARETTVGAILEELVEQAKEREREPAA